MQNQKILIVDDKKENLFTLKKILEEVDAEIISAQTGEEALKLLLNSRFALALLDVQMPEMDGYELAEFIRMETESSMVPIIFLSAVYSDNKHIFKGYEAGAVDFILKPYDPLILVNKVNVFLTLSKQKEELNNFKNHLEDIVASRTLELLSSMTALKEKEIKIEKNLKEKEQLLKEIHHRVKNNLAIISSLLSLQEREAIQEETKNLLLESKNRIKTMALLHENLYETEDLSSIFMPKYLTSLVNNLKSCFSTFTEKIKMVTDFDPIYFNLETALPCALICNELLTNTIKHTFTETISREIHFSLKAFNETGYLLNLKDNGPGLQLDETKSLGMTLVRMLAGQLNAHYEIINNKGTEFRMTFVLKK